MSSQYLLLVFIFEKNIYIDIGRWMKRWKPDNIQSYENK